jgi:hypothetical protein
MNVFFALVYKWFTMRFSFFGAICNFWCTFISYSKYPCRSLVFYHCLHNRDAVIPINGVQLPLYFVQMCISVECDCDGFSYQCHTNHRFTHEVFSRGHPRLLTKQPLALLVLLTTLFSKIRFVLSTVCTEVFITTIHYSIQHR